MDSTTIRKYNSASVDFTCNMPCYSHTQFVLYKHRGHALPVVVAQRVHSGGASLPERQTCAPGHACQHVFLVGCVMNVDFPRGFRMTGGICCKASPDTLE